MHGLKDYINNIYNLWIAHVFFREQICCAKMFSAWKTLKKMPIKFWKFRSPGFATGIL
jgi:hypothetical protein